MKKICIYVLTNSQRGYVEKIIEALTDLVSVDAKLIVSTNTADNVYRHYLMDYCTKYGIDLITHKNCGAKTHAREAYKHCSTDLCMLLHDDDEIYIDAFKAYINRVIQNPGFASYSCNDKIIIENRLKANNIDDRVNFIPTTFEISLSYLLNRHFICYPTVIYDTTQLDINFEDTRFGKYNDALIVLRLVKKGHLFIGTPALGYRIHEQQDSAEKNLIKYVLKIFLIGQLTLSIGKVSAFGLSMIYKKLRYKFVD